MVSPAPEPSYLQIRQRLLHLDPAILGIAPSEAFPDVWEVTVEMGYEVGSATLVVLADGTTSLHYSTGGGLLGRGDYPPVADAAKALILEAQKFLAQMPLTTEFPLPGAGQVSFILHAFSGTYASTAPVKALASGAHELAVLYKRVQDALQQLRLIAEKGR